MNAMPQGPWPRILFAERSDPGRDPDKRENEDASFYAETRLGHLFVLCDGMGGHASGREASNAAIRTINDLVTRASGAIDPGEVLRAAIVAAGRTVYGLGGTTSDPARPGSTCVALLMHPLGTEVAHVGDSRAYVVRGGKLWPLTRDHSMVRELVDAGLLRPEQAINHPEANKITRALGIQPEADVELRPDAILQETADLFLTVSDGVTDVVTDAELEQLGAQALASRDLAGFVQRVVDFANARGGPDNITVQAALVLEPGLLPEARQRPARVAPVTDVGDRITPTGMPSGGRMPVEPHTTGPRGTMRLNIHAPPAPPPSIPGGRLLAAGAVPLATDTPRPAPTVIDDPGYHEHDDEEPPSVAAPASRARRVVIGAVVAALGIALFGFSLSRLLFDDEAPPPMLEMPAASATTPATGAATAPPAASAK